jgi:hypothetical protein
MVGKRFIVVREEVSYYAASQKIAQSALTFFDQIAPIIFGQTSLTFLDNSNLDFFDQTTEKKRIHQSKTLSKLLKQAPDEIIEETSKEISLITLSDNLNQQWLKRKKMDHKIDAVTRLDDFAWLLEKLKQTSQKQLRDKYAWKVDSLMFYVYHCLQKLHINYVSEELQQSVATIQQNLNAIYENSEDVFADHCFSSIRLSVKKRFDQAKNIATFVNQRINETTETLRKAKQQRAQAWRAAFSRGASFESKGHAIRTLYNLKDARNQRRKLAKTITKLKDEIYNGDFIIGSLLLKALAQQKNNTIDRLFFQDKKFTKQCRAKFTKEFFKNMAHPVNDGEASYLVSLILNGGFADILLRSYKFRRNLVRFINKNIESFRDIGDFRGPLLMRLCENKRLKPSRKIKKFLKSFKQSGQLERRSSVPYGTTANLLEGEQPKERRKSESDAKPLDDPPVAVAELKQGLHDDRRVGFFQAPQGVVYSGEKVSVGLSFSPG